MSEWKEVALGDISEFVSKNESINHASLDNYISTENMVSNFGGITKAKTLPKTKRVKVFLKGDILFSNIRTYFKKVWYSTFNGTASSDVIIFRTKDKEVLDQMFLYYALSNPDFTDYTIITSKGAKMPRGDKNAIQRYKFLLPPLAEQKAIAEVLSSLDDKIDLLHRQNKTLEQMAETLFRQWFIEEADNSWEEGTLGDLLRPQRGKNITKDKMIYGEYPVIAAGLSPSGYHNQFNTNHPVITISASGANAGFVQIHHTNIWASDCSYIDNTVYPHICFTYLFLKNNQLKIYDKQEGSVQPHIYPSHLIQLELLIPPNDIISKYENSLRIYFEKIRSNTNQLRSLERLRDTLLPKLLNGEVIVKIEE